MIRRPFHYLGVGFFLILAFALGYALHPAASAPVPNHEQQLRMDFQLAAWLDQNDRLDYDFPTMLDCRSRAKALVCTYGATYMDETTRRCTVTLDQYNVPTTSCTSRPKPRPSVP